MKKDSLDFFPDLRYLCKICLPFLRLWPVESTWQQVDRTLAVSLAKKAERAVEARRVARKSVKVDEEEDEQREDGKGIRRQGRGIVAALATLVVRQASRRWMSLFIKVRSGVLVCRNVHLDGSIESWNDGRISYPPPASSPPSSSSY